jgi:hypothetical protein
VKPVAALKPAGTGKAVRTQSKARVQGRAISSSIRLTVGRIHKVDEQEVAGIKLELFVIGFEQRQDDPSAFRR